MKKRSERLKADARQNAWMSATLAAFALAAGTWSAAAWHVFGDMAGLLVILALWLGRMACGRAAEACRLRRLSQAETVWEQRREVMP